MEGEWYLRYFEALGGLEVEPGEVFCLFSADENRSAVTLFEGLWVEPLGVATELASHSSPLKVSIQCPGGLPDVLWSSDGRQGCTGPDFRLKNQ